MADTGVLKTPTQELLDCLWTGTENVASMDEIVIHFAKILACKTAEDIVRVCQKAVQTHITPKL